jgi:hypothetical protein
MVIVMWYADPSEPGTICELRYAAKKGQGFSLHRYFEGRSDEPDS